VTPESLRAEADALDAEAERLRREAQKRRALAGQIEQLGETETPLPQSASYATIETMATAAATNPSPLTFRRGAPLESDGPIATVAKKLGVPAAEIARRLNVNPITARNWDKRGKIPHLAIREALAKIAAGSDPEAKPKKPKRQ